MYITGLGMTPNSNTKIIVTTIHKFMYIKDIVENLREKSSQLLLMKLIHPPPEQQWNRLVCPFFTIDGCRRNVSI